MPATSPGHASLSHFQACNALPVTHPADACLLVTFHDTWNLFSKAFCSLSIPSRERPSLPSCLLRDPGSCFSNQLGDTCPTNFKTLEGTLSAILPCLRTIHSAEHLESTQMLVGRMTLTFNKLPWVHEPKLHYFSDRNQSEKRKEYWFYFIKLSWKTVYEALQRLAGRLSCIKCIKRNNKENKLHLRYHSIEKLFSSIRQSKPQRESKLGKRWALYFLTFCPADTAVCTSM